MSTMTRRVDPVVAREGNVIYLRDRRNFGLCKRCKGERFEKDPRGHCVEQWCYRCTAAPLRDPTSNVGGGGEPANPHWLSDPRIPWPEIEKAIYLLQSGKIQELREFLSVFEVAVPDLVIDPGSL